MKPRCIRISFEDEAELDRKLVLVMNKRGFTVERRTEQVTVKALAARVGRPVASVSRALHRASCPPFDACYGRGNARKRILRITPNARLLDWLRL